MDRFQSLREDLRERENDEKNFCLLCDVPRSKLDLTTSRGSGFDDHKRHVHNVSKLASPRHDSDPSRDGHDGRED